MQMKKFVEDSNETQKLTDSIRKLGTPYVSNEPESVYWANFRFRGMDRTAEGDKKTVLAWPNSIREFVVGHVLGTSISFATLAILVTLAVIVKPFSGHQSQAPQLAAVTPKPAATKQFSPEQQAQVEKQASAPAIRSERIASNIRHAHSIARKSPSEKSEDLASLNDTENEP